MIYSITKKTIYAFLSLLIPIYFLCTTNFGLQIIFKGIAFVIPGKLSVAQLDGKLISHFYLKDLNYQSAEGDFTVNTLRFKWSPAQLVKNKVRINLLVIDKMNIHLSKNKNQNNSFDIQQLHWLQNIIIRDLSIHQMKIVQDQKPLLNIDSIEIKEQSDHYYSLIARTTQGDIDGKYRFNWDTHLAWEMILNIHQLNLQPWINDKKTNIHATVTSNGSWHASNHEFEFNLKNLSGTFEQHVLKGNANINYRNGKVLIKNLDLAIANAFVKLSGTIDHQSEITWQIQIPSLQTILPEAHGRIYGKGRITGLKNNLNIFLDLQVNKFIIPNFKIDRLDAKIDSKNAGQLILSRVFIKNISSNGNRIPVLTLNLTSRLLNNNLVSHTNMILDSQNQISGDIRLNNIKNFNANTAIKGNLILSFKNLNKWIVSPYIKNLQGNLSADLQLSGKINNPNYFIKAQVNRGQLFVPKLNLYIKNINAILSYHVKQPVIFSGTFNTGEGKGKLQGKFNPEVKEKPLELNLSGKHLQILNLSEYKIKASPELFIFINTHDTRIKGSLFDVSAQINPKDFSSVTTLPKETIILNKTSSENNLPQNLSLQVQIILGDNNVIAYENLQTELKGKLSILQKSGQMPTANGELYTVKGNYRAYGNLLKITQGKLIYTGNVLNNPGLSIKAIKKLETSSFAQDQSQFASEHQTNSLYQGVKHIKVGIDVIGTLKKPQISFHSDPAGMSQNDILSYLLFGYPQSEIKNINGFEILNKVIASLNNGASTTDKLTKKIQNTFGLNNLGISSIETYDADKNKSQSNSALNIEKKLNKNFSIQYRVGIFNAASVLNIKYKINKIFALQSESSTQSNGVDLLFEYEYD